MTDISSPLWQQSQERRSQENTLNPCLPLCTILFTAFTDIAVHGHRRDRSPFQDNAVFPVYRFNEENFHEKRRFSEAAIVTGAQSYFHTRDCFPSRTERESAALATLDQILYLPFLAACNCNVATPVTFGRTCKHRLGPPARVHRKIIYDRSHPISRLASLPLRVSYSNVE